MAEATVACCSCASKRRALIVIEPYEEGGRRYIRKRFQDPETRADLFVVELDAELARLEVQEQRSVL